MRNIETSFPMMLREGDREERISEKLSIYQVILVNMCAITDRRGLWRACRAMFCSANPETAGPPCSTLCIALKT